MDTASFHVPYLDSSRLFSSLSVIGFPKNLYLTIWSCSVSVPPCTHTALSSWILTVGNPCACSFTALHWSVHQHLPLLLCSLLRASPCHLSFLLSPDCGHSIPGVVLPCQPRLFSPVHPRSHSPSTQYSMSLSAFLFVLLQSALQTVIRLSFPHKFMTTFSKSSVTLFLLPFRKSPILSLTLEILHSPTICSVCQASVAPTTFINLGLHKT